MWRHADLKVQGKYYLQLWAQLNLNILDKISSFLKKTNKPIHYQKLKEKGGGTTNTMREILKLSGLILKVTV